MIETVFNKIGYFTSRFSGFILLILSITFAVLIAIQLVIAGASIWLNGESGQNLIREQLVKVSQDTGYDITFDKISYAFLRGLKIQNLEIKDDDGLILDINTATINPNIIGLSMRYFGLSMGVDKLTLYRLPKSKDKIDSEPFILKPFSLPEIYFTSLGIDKLSFENLHIKKDVFGTDLQFSPSLTTQISIADTIDLSLNLKSRSSDIAWMPDRVLLKATLDQNSLDLKLENLIAENENIEIQAHGDANLSDKGRVNLETILSLNDFTPFTKDIKGTVKAKAAVTGSFDTLSLQSDGYVSMPLLNEREIDDIAFTITDDNLSSSPLGQINLKTQYKNKPVNISAIFDITDNLATIQSINGTAPDLNIGGDVIVNLDNFLATGIVKIDAPKISTYSAIANMNIKGEANAVVTLTDKNDTQGIDVTVNTKNGQYEDIKIGKADITTSIADIKNLWPDVVTANATSINLAKNVTIDSLKINLSEQNDDKHLLSINANGQALQKFDLKGTAILNALKNAQFNAEKIDLKILSKGSALNIVGEANLKTLNMKLKTNNFNLSSLPVSLPEQMRDFALDMNASISGEMAKPIITSDFDLEPITILKGSRIKLSGKAKYSDNFARVDVSGTGDAINAMNGFVQLPVKLSLNPFLFDMSGATQLDGKIVMDAQARAIASLILPVGHKLTGNVNANAVIAGTIDKPDLSGNVALSDGTYLFNAYGVELFDIDMKANLSRDALQITTLHADDGRGGQLNGNGHISFAAQQNTKLDLNLTDFKLLDSDKAKGNISADLDLQGRNQDYLLSGKIILGEFNIIIPERFQSKIPELNIVKNKNEENNKQQLNVVTMDVDVVADDRIFVRGWGLDAEFGGNLNIGGTLDNPQLDGMFKSKRGRYEEFGRRFTLDRAILRFQGSAPPSPYLDIMATTNADEINASVNLSGEVGNPSIALSSVPSMPEDEVMSHILFGENLSKITPFQAIQLKQTLDRFTGKGGGGFDPLGKLRNVTGLDDIRVDTNDEGETSVGVGKYLTDDVYLELEKGSGDESGSAKIQVELTPSINLESEVGQDAQAGGGILWRWDY